MKREYRDHYRARAYDPVTGRFLQQDPVFSVNPYPYVGNNPVNFTDPFGLWFSFDTKIGDYCKGEDCHSVGFLYGTMYCESKGCRNCGSECQDCIVKSCGAPYKIDEPNYYRNSITYPSPYTATSGEAWCTECWWGPRVADCASQCQYSNDPDCFRKCLRAQVPSPGGGGGNPPGSILPTPGSGEGNGNDRCKNICRNRSKKECDCCKSIDGYPDQTCVESCIDNLNSSCTEEKIGGWWTSPGGGGIGTPLSTTPHCMSPDQARHLCEEWCKGGGDPNKPPGLDYYLSPWQNIVHSFIEWFPSYVFSK